MGVVVHSTFGFPDVLLECVVFQSYSHVLCVVAVFVLREVCGYGLLSFCCQLVL